MEYGRPRLKYVSINLRLVHTSTSSGRLSDEYGSISRQSFHDTYNTKPVNLPIFPVTGKACFNMVLNAMSPFIGNDRLE